MAIARTDWVLGRVSRRMTALRVARAFRTWTLILTAAYGVLLLAVRLLALVPDWLPPWSVALPPASALLISAALAKRPTRAEAARRLDSHAATNDLFLTTVLIDDSAGGGFKPLVAEMAAATASSIRPADVVRFRLPRSGWLPAFLVAALAAGVLWLPQLDPFRKAEERNKRALQEKRLLETRKAVALRAEEIRRGADDTAPTKARKAIEDLMAALNRVEPNRRDANLGALDEQQRRLEEQWRRLSEARLKNALDTAQGFGAGSEKTAQWKKDLGKGDLSEARKEAARLAAEARALAAAAATPEKERRKEQLRRDLKALSEFMASNLGSQNLNAALSSAAEQISLSGAGGLSEQAMEAVAASLGLADLELGELQKMLLDLRDLEAAMSVLQQAKRLNDLDALNGGSCGQFSWIADYASYYNQLASERGLPGPGMRGDGTGAGGNAPEDEAVTSAFTPEAARTAFTAGKILLSWSTNERDPGDPGKALKSYEERLQEVKQGASEAVLQEQIPREYQDTIRKYFDTMEKPVDPARETNH